MVAPPYPSFRCVFSCTSCYCESRERRGGKKDEGFNENFGFAVHRAAVAEDASDRVNYIVNLLVPTSVTPRAS